MFFDIYVKQAIEIGLFTEEQKTAITSVITALHEQNQADNKNQKLETLGNT